MFEIDIYDTNFEKVGIIDSFDSFIWTTRYQDCGNFELKLKPDSREFKYFKKDYYINMINDNNYNDREIQLMIVEDLKITYNVEQGDSAIITGRDLSSILDRRILWKPTWYAGSINDGVKMILQNNIISPPDDFRKIDKFIYRDTTDERILRLGMELKEVGINVYEVIKKIASTYNIGFRTLFDIVDKTYIFELYKGIDRGINNPDGNLVVEFSERNDNLLNSNFVDCQSKFKNVILIGGEGEDDKQYFTSLNNNFHKGLKRKEAYYNSSVSMTVEDDIRLSAPEYERQLKEEGKMELKKVEVTTAFEGDVRALEVDMFTYNKDFKMGDIVYIHNEYDMETDAFVSETVESYDESGYLMTPTFKSIEKDPGNIFGTIYIDETNHILTIKDISKPVRIKWGDGQTEVFTPTETVKDISHDYALKGTVEEYTGLYDFYIYRADYNDMDFCPSFKDSTVLYKIEIPNGVTALKQQTFYNCSLLNYVYLPPSLITFEGTDMFYKCNNLYSISLPNSLKNVGGRTFYDCENLINCDVSYNISTIPSKFFDNCPKLREVKFLGNSIFNIGVKIVSTNAMNNCNKINSLIFGSTLETIYGNCLVSNNEEGCDVTVMKDIPPTLVGSFTGFKLNEIVVPNSPKFDDEILNKYKSASGWSSHSSIIREEDGEIEQEQTSNSDYEYAENAESDDDEQESDGREYENEDDE